MKKSTNTLTSILTRTEPGRIDGYLEENAEEILSGDHPFTAYMHERIREKKIHLQDIFLRADISEGYGYKLISGEKHTRQRDTVIKLCLGAEFTLEETQRALKIYGFSPLYARFPRDAVLITAISAGKHDLSDINRLLSQNRQPRLKGSEEI